MRKVDEYEVLDRVLRITKKEKYADKVKEVYDLTKKIVLKTNEIDDDEAREATLYATIGFLIEKVKVGLPVRITNQNISIKRELKVNVVFFCLKSS